ncbi:MAG: 4-(cytidine 5'-diphospho)-2-C-methyl-D-erythritol kinase [Clostridia bacterium]|nr:4-(cytidine 5'-diphospho)-2-C-methyl-D-erythritol kinase [Clostridia bacterium]
MSEIELKARAKVNLTLDVLRKRPDGYHDLSMIMQSIELHDKIILTEAERGISIQADTDIIPLDENNLTYKAAALIQRKKGIKKGINIFIQKNIPVCAGMAGGSTDAAAVIKGLNRLWNLNMDMDEMMRIGAEIGADVPFCILGGTALARGIGDILTTIEFPCKVWIVMVKPSFGISTAQVYGNLDLNNVYRRPDTDGMIKCLKSCNIKSIGLKLFNVLETVTVNLYPALNDVKEDIFKYGCEGTVMTGSGPTVYGIFSSWSRANSAYNALKEKYQDVFFTHTYNSPSNN